MKKTFFALAIAGFIYAGCGNQSSENTHEHDGNTHVHEDGTVHENHDDMEQEEFNPGDTSLINPDTAHQHVPGTESDHKH